MTLVFLPAPAGPKNIRCGISPWSACAAQQPQRGVLTGCWVGAAFALDSRARPSPAEFKLAHQR